MAKMTRKEAEARARQGEGEFFYLEIYGDRVNQGKLKALGSGQGLSEGIAMLFLRDPYLFKQVDRYLPEIRRCIQRKENVSEGFRQINDALGGKNDTKGS